MDAQRTTQLENGACRLFPLPPPALARDSTARGGEGGYFHLSSIGHYHFPTVLDTKQPAALRPQSVSLGSRAWLCSGVLRQWGCRALGWGFILALCIV